MRFKVQEFISQQNSGDLISGDEPGNLGQTGTTSKSTTDQHVGSVTQPVSFSNYRRYPLEAPLPFNEQADQMQEEPEKFYNFLKERGMEETFEAYFVEAPMVDPKKEIQEMAKQRALEMAEQLLNQKRNNADVVKREVPIPTLDEVKAKDGLIIGKLEKIAEYCKTNMSEGEKKVILSHFNSLING